MPPNCKEEKLPTTECAAPFKDEQNGSGVARASMVQSGNPSTFVSLHQGENRETDLNRSVNTTHQYTYELDRYHKNAMLLLHYDYSYIGSRETANKVKSTFEMFRFEVEVHHNARGEEVKAISEAFFQRDFTEYGAVGVVVIGVRAKPSGGFMAPGPDFVDKDILNYMVTANLQPKPKIIIFECDRIPRRSLTRAYANNDVIDYNFPALVNTSTEPNRFYNPLSFFCDELNRLADRQSLDNILYGVSVKALIKKWQWPPLFNDSTFRDLRPLFSRTYVNLPKRLYLWRNL